MSAVPLKNCDEIPVLLQTAPVPESVHVPEPIFKVFPIAETKPAVTLYDTASKVPDVSVRVVDDDKSRASPN